VKSDILLLRLPSPRQALKAPKAREHIEALASRFDAAAYCADTSCIAGGGALQPLSPRQQGKASRWARENWKLQRDHGDARILLEAALGDEGPEGWRRRRLTGWSAQGTRIRALRGTAEKLKASSDENASCVAAPVCGIARVRS